MQIVSVIQQKGGVGKTTILTALAGIMAQDGARVLICDSDVQQNSQAWAERSNFESIDYVDTIDEDTIEIAVGKAYESQYDILLLDTAGLQTSLISYVAALSDLVIIPFDTAQSDLDGAISTAKLIASGLFDGRLLILQTYLYFVLLHQCCLLFYIA